MTEDIYIMFVENCGYVIKYSINSDIIKLTLPLYFCDINYKEIKFPKDFKKILEKRGFKKKGIEKLEHYIFSLEWEMFDTINPKSGVISHEK